MAHRYEPACAAPTREIGGRGHVVHAAREIVGLAVADPHGSDAARCQAHAEIVVQPVGRSEQAPHAAAARDEHFIGVDRSVPHEREQAVHRVHLEVPETVGDLDLLHRERLEQLERRARVVGHSIDCSSALVAARSSRAPKIDATKSVTPASAMRPIPARTVASSPTIATSAGPAAPSRSSMARYDGRKPYTWKSLAARSRAASASAVTHTGRLVTMRGAGRPARSAAAVIAGTVCSASVAGPVIRVTVPSVTVPASSSIFGPSAATSAGTGGRSGTSSAAWVVIVSPSASALSPRRSGISTARYSRM